MSEKQISGQVQRVSAATQNGNTVYYVMLREESAPYYFNGGSFEEKAELALTAPGDFVSFTLYPNEPHMLPGESYNFNNTELCRRVPPTIWSKEAP